jgi:hypothetical protein
MFVRGLRGGVFANVKINQRVHAIPGVDSVFVFPAMSDEGIAAGAALTQWARSTPEPASGARCFDHVYLGHDFSEKQVAEALSAAGFDYTRPDDLPYMLRSELDLLYTVFLEDMQLAREGILNQGPINSMVSAHRAEMADHGNRLWLLLNSELWYRMFVQNQAEAELTDRMAEGSRSGVAP